ASADDELKRMQLRLWICAALTIPLLLFSMSPMLDVSPSVTISPLAQLLLSAPVVLWGGAPFFERGWTSLRTLRFNMFTLISLGTGPAFLFSLASVVAPG